MTVEFVHGDAWERLTELAAGFNQTEMAEKFRQAVTTRNDQRVFFRNLLEQRMIEEAEVSRQRAPENELTCSI